MRRIALLALLSLLLTGCTNLFFMPMERLVRTPAEIGLEYRDVSFRSSDGTLLHGWWLPAKGTTRGTMLFLHGNAENISTHIASVHWLPEQGYNVFLFDYRGYGKSQGASEIEGVIRDVESAIATTLELQKNSDQSIIVFGQSLGGGLAIYAVAHSAHRDQIKALIVESGFSSYRQIAREKFAGFWLTWPLQYPLSWTVTDRYKPIDSVADIAPIPLLLIYGKADSIVPYHHGQQLFDAAAPPKALWLIPDGRHIATFASPLQRQRLLDYLMALP
ncbi:MAG: alpha/beta hydrolase [Pseudomonadota bacterium]|nr:alpha/beta hydrolase [Pseudomonadota bacterium]